jgi:fucose permease
MRPPARVVLPVTVLAAFVLIGLPDGMLGVAWPSMRDAFGRTNGALGLLSVVAISGAFIASLGNGPLMRRLGFGNHFTLATAVFLLGLSGFSVANSWSLLLVAAFVAGFGAGAVDAGGNSYVALRQGLPFMNAIHASYGIGTMTGPLAVTAAVEVGSWRSAYAAVSVPVGALLIGFFIVRRSWPLLVVPPVAAPSNWHSPARGLSILTLAFVFLCTGLEITIGTWSYSLLTQTPEIGATVAASAVTAYWGCLTASRIVLIAIGRRIRPETVLAAGVGGMIVASALLWTDALPYGRIVALELSGISLGPIFPALIALTPRRLGEDRAESTIGYLVAAAILGSGAFAGLAGVAVTKWGLAAIGPLIFAGSALQGGAHLITRRLSMRG